MDIFKEINGSNFQKRLFGDVYPLDKLQLKRLVKIGPVVLEKKLKMWKVYRQTDEQRDKRRTIGDQKSALNFRSGELKMGESNRDVRAD